MSRSSHSPVPSRWRRRLSEAGGALVLLAVIAVGLVAQHWYAARQEVADAVAEADRLDPGWRFEELEAQRRLPPPEQNSALQVLTVQSLLPPSWNKRPPGPKGEDRGYVSDVLNDLTPERQIDERQARQLREDLGRLGQALDAVRKLADMPEGRYPVAWAADVDSTSCPWSDAVHSAAYLLEIDGLSRNQEGDPDDALRSARALLNVGRSLGEEPFLYGPVYRLGCRFRAASAIERTLAQGQASDAALVATQEVVRREDAVSLSLAYFRGHRAMTHRFLSQVDNGEHRLSERG